MSSPAITLYDISSRLNPQAWSPNTWKARTVLNYKRIPYKTEWISYPDIQKTSKSLGCTHNKMQGGEPIYTLPIIVDTSGGTPVVISDSLEITKYLDATYPDRPVLPKNGLVDEHTFDSFLTEVIGRHLRFVTIPLTYDILDDRGQVYYAETRSRWHGKTIDEMKADRHKHWDAIENGFNKLADLLDKNGPGVQFVGGGSEPTRADFILVSYLAYTRAVAPDEAWKDRIQKWNGGRWQRLWDLSEEWRSVH